MPFKPGQSGNPAGRPRGRIAELRATMGELSNGGRTVAERLHGIIMDPESSRREVVDAATLWLAYLVGKPEQAVTVEADITAGPRPQIDLGAVLRALPSDVLDKVVEAIDAAEAPALQPGDG